MNSTQEPILSGVRETIIVLSGKGGVGKSSVSLQLATSLMMKGFRVGILDLDLCGPSIARITGSEGRDILTAPDGKWIPIAVDNEKKMTVFSLAFFLESKNDAVIWRGPKKNSMIKQLLSNIVWNVDYLIIDTPPGTSDEHISLMENIRNIVIKGAILVTTPQMVAVDDVLREVTFCKQTNLPILGVIENMSGFACPNCSECTNIFAEHGGKLLADSVNIPFLGKIPIDPHLAECLENGENYLSKYSSSAACAAFASIVDKIEPAQSMDVAS